MRYRSIHLLLTEQLSHFGHPERAIIFGMLPNMLIPPGRVYACPITAEKAEAAVCPRYPCTFNFNLGQSLKQCIIVFLFGHIGKCRCMPGAADNSNITKHVFLGLP